MIKQTLRDFKKEATEKALAEAAFELALEHGLDGFVVEDIVQKWLLQKNFRKLFHMQGRGSCDGSSYRTEHK